MAVGSVSSEASPLGLWMVFLCAPVSSYGLPCVCVCVLTPLLVRTLVILMHAHPADLILP